MAAKAACDNVVANCDVENGSRRPMVLCFLLVFAGFTLTSTTYLAWLYNLMNFPEAGSVEAMTVRDVKRMERARRLWVAECPAGRSFGGHLSRRFFKRRQTL